MRWRELVCRAFLRGVFVEISGERGNVYSPDAKRSVKAVFDSQQTTIGSGLKSGGVEFGVGMVYKLAKVDQILSRNN